MAKYVFCGVKVNLTFDIHSLIISSLNPSGHLGQI